MQELRLVAVSEDGTYLVLATAGRGTRFTLPVDERLRAAVRGNFSRLGQYEIEVESPLRPKEIQARIRAGETAEEIAATAGIPVERVRWFEGPVLQEREYTVQQAQRVAVRLPGETTPGPTLGELVTERLSRRGVPSDEIDWDSCKRDDGLWRIKLGFVWNGHTRSAEWLFDLRRRHVTPYDDEALRLSASDYVEQAEDATVTPFVPRLAAKLSPVPAIPVDAPTTLPGVVRHDPVTRPHPEPSRPDLAPEPARPRLGSEPARPRLGGPSEHARPYGNEPEPAEPAAFRQEPTRLHPTEPAPGPAGRPASEATQATSGPTADRAPRPTFEPAVQQTYERSPQPTFEPAAGHSSEPARFAEPARPAAEPADDRSFEPTRSSEPARPAAEPAARHSEEPEALHRSDPGVPHHAEPAPHMTEATLRAAAGDATGGDAMGTESLPTHTVSELPAAASQAAEPGTEAARSAEVQAPRPAPETRPAASQIHPAAPEAQDAEVPVVRPQTGPARPPAAKPTTHATQPAADEPAAQATQPRGAKPAAQATQTSGSKPAAQAIRPAAGEPAAQVTHPPVTEPEVRTAKASAAQHPAPHPAPRQTAAPERKAGRPTPLNPAAAATPEGKNPAVAPSPGKKAPAAAKPTEADEAGMAAVPAARTSGETAERPAAAVEPERADQPDKSEKEPKAAEPPVPQQAPKPARPARKGSRGRRASVPTWDEIMFGARRQD